MEIKMRNVAEITPYENNPRHNEEAVEKVAASIREFGFNVPIIIDKNDVIVAGHTRLEAAKSLGMESVPTICADHLTDDQVRAFRLADNKVSEFSKWDLEKLEAELSQLNFDMTDFGFDFDMEIPDYDDGEDGEDREGSSQIPQLKF